MYLAANHFDLKSTLESHSWKCVINGSIFHSKFVNSRQIKVEFFPSSNLTSKSSRNLVERLPDCLMKFWPGIEVEIPVLKMLEESLIRNRNQRRILIIEDFSSVDRPIFDLTRPRSMVDFPSTRNRGFFYRPFGLPEYNIYFVPFIDSKSYIVIIEA